MASTNSQYSHISNYFKKTVYLLVIHNLSLTQNTSILTCMLLAIHSESATVSVREGIVVCVM